MEVVDRSLLEQWVKQRLSFEEISDNLKGLYPNISRGLSVRSVRRYCKQNGLKRPSLNEVDALVETATNEV